MQLTDKPSQIVLPFANAGAKNTIPVTTSGVPGSASFTGGFPPETMEPVTSGGVPPAGKDFNGIFFDLSAIDRWISAGAGFPWSSSFSTAVGGYPKGSRVFRADGTGYWLSVADNNTTNPDTGGAGWVAEGGGGVASVYASTNQTLPGSGSESKILFDTVDFDARGFWNAGSHRYTALYAGVYRLSGSILLASPPGQLFIAQVYKNGAFYKQCTGFPQVSNVPLSYPFDAMINCAIGDYLEVFMYSGGASSTVSGGSGQGYVYADLEYLGQ